MAMNRCILVKKKKSAICDRAEYNSACGEWLIDVRQGKNCIFPMDVALSLKKQSLTLIHINYKLNFELC
jgi:hypothetical protein